MHVYVSLVVTEESETIQNTLLRMDMPLEPAEAEAYRAALDHWLAERPIPGELYPVRPQPEEQQTIFKTVDSTDLVAQLPPILARGRDPFIFGPNDVDDEFRDSRRYRRPYDREKIKL